MSDFIQEMQSMNVDFMGVLVDIRLTNITEIKILQEVVCFIDTYYEEHKTQINPAEVAALILNRQDIPNLYATSSRGYNNQVLEFQNQFGITGFKIKNKLIPWAIDKILRLELPQNLYQDLEKAKKAARNPTKIDDESFLAMIANLNLANVTEFQVMKEACTYIYNKYPDCTKRINLSDVCALILNHPSVFSLYATTDEEYEKLREVYLSEHQFQVNEVIEQMVEKIYGEETKLSISHESLVSVNFRRRKKIVQSWNL